MIGKLSGLVDSSGAGWAIIDVSGVGYLTFCSARTLTRLPAPGQPARLLIESHVREDHIHLYGFVEAAERDWFRLLSSVQGVGARMALAILSVLAPDQVVRAIAAEDQATLTRANGVGRKLAGRIVAELKDKVGDLAVGAAATVGAGKPAADGISEDAVSALVNLGYARGEAFGAIARATRNLGAEAGLDEVIRVGLQELAL